MNKALERLFKDDINERVPCIVTARRGIGSYVVKDDLNRSFIVSGPIDVKLAQRVVVLSGVIVEQSLRNRTIRRIIV